MLISDEPKARRRRRIPPGYAKGNLIVWLEVSPYVRRAYWCSGVLFEQSDLDPVRMTLKSLNCTLKITVVLDIADQPTKDWGRAVSAEARHGDLMFRIDLGKRICIRLSDRYPVLH